MNLTLELHNKPSQSMIWEITADDLFEMQDVFATILGKPAVFRHGEPYDLDHHIEVRMGEIGSPKKEITVEPQTQPQKAPEPISTPAPERQPETVPA